MWLCGRNKDQENVSRGKGEEEDEQLGDVLVEGEAGAYHVCSWFHRSMEGGSRSPAVAGEVHWAGRTTLEHGSSNGIIAPVSMRSALAAPERARPRSKVWSQRRSLEQGES